MLLHTVKCGWLCSLAVARAADLAIVFVLLRLQAQQRWRSHSSLGFGRMGASQTRMVSDGAAQRSYVVLAPPVETQTETAAGDGERAEATAEHNRGAADTAQRIAAYNDAALQVSLVTVRRAMDVV